MSNNVTKKPENMTKKDLAVIVEAQEEKIKKYEKRLGDLVVAYRGLLKEKEALENSLKVFTVSKNDNDNAKQLNESASDCSDKEISDSSPHLETLKNSLSTLTQEKSRIEANYLGDKKKLMVEKEELSKQLIKEKEISLHIRNTLEANIQEIKLQLRDEQLNREIDEQSHSSMIKEIQQLLSNERFNKNNLEAKIEEQNIQIEKLKNAEKKTDQQLQKFKELNTELHVVQEKLALAEDKANQPSPFLLNLKQEMCDMRNNNQMALEEAQKQLNSAEAKLLEANIQHEERVALLESKIFELSQIVGSYDSLRQNDLKAIQNLKDEVSQLGMDNMDLTHVINNCKSAETTNDLSNLDVKVLIEKLKLMKRYLKEANLRSSKPFDINDLFYNLDDEFHSKCQEELKQLKQEFDNYKYNFLMKGKLSETTDEEVDNLKQQVLELKKKINLLRTQLEETKKAQKKVSDNMQDMIKETKAVHKQKLISLEAEYQNQLAELELEVHKHRERTMELLKEKDRELELLKSQLPKPPEVESIPDIDELPELLGSSFYPGNSSSKGIILHYVQEISRKDVELSNLRRSKNQTEAALYELQQSMLVKEENYLEKIEFLQSKIRRIESYQSSGILSLEYLKNVVLNYMLCSENNSRKHMLNAIGAVLDFSPQEIKQVVQFNQTGWWVYSSK